MFSQLVHIGFDLAVVAALLAGIRRTTGLTVRLNDNPSQGNVSLVRKYLDFGERTLDFIVGFMTMFPKYFVRQSG
ncbi:hypothetical protein BB560_002107 [Smittium megazygosporum]|uniref:DUF1748-domain-containing protein n=1 Tax=Smittium megazygosporum TaxID=133381 RepID=A0A2T9ZFN6_9FUNG|nr:hypothetical protein BB560_005706 [Smittium megazygosporum]PVV03413.1 hypothetical protein BB560_002107 [Smittium megazygosporum]